MSHSLRKISLQDTNYCHGDNCYKIHITITATIVTEYKLLSLQQLLQIHIIVTAKVVTGYKLLSLNGNDGRSLGDPSPLAITVGDTPAKADNGTARPLYRKNTCYRQIVILSYSDK